MSHAPASFSLYIVPPIITQTVFLYLNDVEEGGGTRFTDLDITIMPKRGRVVVWPSVLDHALLLMEPKTHHEALPVIKGVKYGANAWVSSYWCAFLLHGKRKCVAYLSRFVALDPLARLQKALRRRMCLIVASGETDFVL